MDVRKAGARSAGDVADFEMSDGVGVGYCILWTGCIHVLFVCSTWSHVLALSEARMHVYRVCLVEGGHG